MDGIRDLIMLIINPYTPYVGRDCMLLLHVRNPEEKAEEEPHATQFVYLNIACHTLSYSEALHMLQFLPLGKF